MSSDDPLLPGPAPPYPSLPDFAALSLDLIDVAGKARWIGHHEQKLSNADPKVCKQARADADRIVRAADAMLIAANLLQARRSPASSVPAATETERLLQEIREAFDQFAESSEAPDGDACGDNWMRLALLLQDIPDAARSSHLAKP